MEETKTYFDWLAESNIKVVGLEQHPDLEHKTYTQVCLTVDQFTEYVDELRNHTDIKIEDGFHLKSDKYLELRMYSLVPYNLLGIQMGIQHEHGTTSLALKHFTTLNTDIKYTLWASEWKTSILLNGGTSNEGHFVRHGFRDVWYIGSMQKHLAKIEEMDIPHATFYEPDLNSMLTSISMIVDERIFNRRYPNLRDYTKQECGLEFATYRKLSREELETLESKHRPDWVEIMGGEKNAFLKDFLPRFDLARG